MGRELEVGLGSGTCALFLEEQLQSPILVAQIREDIVDAAVLFMVSRKIYVALWRVAAAPNLHQIWHRHAGLADLVQV